MASGCGPGGSEGSCCVDRPQTNLKLLTFVKALLPLPTPSESQGRYLRQAQRSSAERHSPAARNASEQHHDHELCHASYGRHDAQIAAQSDGRVRRCHVQLAACAVKHSQRFALPSPARGSDSTVQHCCQFAAERKHSVGEEGEGGGVAGEGGRGQGGRGGRDGVSGRVTVDRERRQARSSEGYTLCTQALTPIMPCKFM